MRPFPESPGRVKFLVVIVYYLTKWIEVEPLACIAGRLMIKVLWKNIITTFGTPKIQVSDNRLQFAENLFRSWYAEKAIEKRFTLVHTPKLTGRRKYPIARS